MENIELKRHSLAHVLAAAIMKLYPTAKLTIGPAIDNGFYYDIDFGDEKFSDEHLAAVEMEMDKIIQSKAKFIRSEMSIDEVMVDNEYKAELINDLKAAGEKSVSFYALGDFVDLCRGPHVEYLSSIKPGSYKLDKVAGAYWRGSEKNKMLTRIYGLAFDTKLELKQYLDNLAEAEKRDHRKLGKEMDLFSMHEEAPGMPFFHPKGAAIYNLLKDFWMEMQKEYDYEYLICPSMLDVSMWKRSGHFDHYRDDMYFIQAEEGEKQFALRPMDCPGAILVYNNSPKSYRDLPLRYAEPGLITRKEKSGQLGGLIRVQQFVQDDAHIFITPEQIESEIKDVILLVSKIYHIFGLEYMPYLSTRPDDFMGEIKTWDAAEASLKKVLSEVYGDNYGLKEKDGAFYGPKIDFQLKDCLGRTHQCATIQLDFQMPQKFDCKYIDRDGKEKSPVLIHRTIIGSFERFMGIIIEHYAGNFPLWLAPVQVKIVSVGDGHIEYCKNLAKEFKHQNIRVEVDSSDETVGNKIRKAANEKVPYMLVIGDKEMDSTDLSVRDRGQRESRIISKDDFLNEIKDKVKRFE